MQIKKILTLLHSIMTSAANPIFNELEVYLAAGEKRTSHTSIDSDMSLTAKSKSFFSGNQLPSVILLSSRMTPYNFLVSILGKESIINQCHPIIF